MEMHTAKMQEFWIDAIIIGKGMRSEGRMAVIAQRGWVDRILKSGERSL